MPSQFTGGVHTTSRIESLNSLVKKYLNSKAEISDLIKFLRDFERKFVFEKENNSDFRMISGQDTVKDQKTKSPISFKTQYEIHPIVSALKKLLSPLILNKHIEQFNLSHNYVCKHDLNKFNTTFFKVASTLAKDKEKFREVRIFSNKYHCECATYYRHGLICRHIFALAIMFQEKNCDKLIIHKRWISPYDEKEGSTEDYTFEAEKVSQYLKESNLKEEEKSDENETKRKKNFQKVQKGKGAPKKKKRAKSILENKSKSKKSKVTSRNKLRFLHLINFN